MKRDFSFPEEVSGLKLETLRSWTAGMAVFVYRAGPFLIDCGPRHARRQLLRWRELDRARTCLLTHHDEDHTGNVGALADRGLQVLAPPPVLAELNPTRRLPLYRRWVWGTASAGPVSALGEDASADGWRLRPIHTGGHCADHFVYFEPERGILFSGDLYVGRRVPLARSREDVDQLLASLAMVRELRPRVMFCAHRGRVDHPGEALNAKIEWLEESVGGAQRLAAEGLTVKQITRRLLGRDGAVAWVSRGEFCKRNLVEAALRARVREAA